ncbi:MULTISPECIES: hypothetical protein [Streptomyces]|uniref:hypothetical protein n=1 Tax=Streptomyces TaxID=1883 RepID=UPI00240E3ABC|nr:MULTISPECIES: hypothetical protein [Streptomyces]WFB83734.1 hypothetical protein MMU79_10645 [Streptomyces olivaceus]WGK50648.1 hypothetical protein M6G09_36360 [Streptomyces sp. B146]
MLMCMPEAGVQCHAQALRDGSVSLNEAGFLHLVGLGQPLVRVRTTPGEQPTKGRDPAPFMSRSKTVGPVVQG